MWQHTYWKRRFLNTPRSVLSGSLDRPDSVWWRLQPASFRIQAHSDGCVLLSTHQFLTHLLFRKLYTSYILNKWSRNVTAAAINIPHGRLHKLTVVQSMHVQTLRSPNTDGCRRRYVVKHNLITEVYLMTVMETTTCFGLYWPSSGCLGNLRASYIAAI